MSATSLAALIQRFFTRRLQTQLGASAHTVAAYRDTFRLLLAFASARLAREPSNLCLEDLDAAFLSSFLDHLENQRASTAKTRNCRLAALRSFFRFVSYEEPQCALQCQQVLAIPTKRHEQRSVEFLNEQETAALLSAPDVSTWIGRRDHTLLLVAVQTGLRNAELRSLRCRDVELGVGAHIHCLGKGRKTRCTPLRSHVVAEVRVWLAEQHGLADEPLFPGMRGGFLSADALQRTVSRHVASACTTCPMLRGRRITPHTLRHTAAMALLNNGVDLTVIALWLGHESIETTNRYLHADLQLKERALGYSDPAGVPPTRFQPQDSLLSFLKSL